MREGPDWTDDAERALIGRTMLARGGHGAGKALIRSTMREGSQLDDPGKEAKIA